MNTATVARADRPASRPKPGPEPTPAEARVLALMADPARRGWSPDRLARAADASLADAARVYLRLAERTWRLPPVPEPVRLRVVVAPEPEANAVPSTRRRPGRFVRGLAERDAYHKDLARRRDAGDASARNELVEANLPLALSIAAKASAQHPQHHDDLYSEACRGLIRAAESFDPAQGAFSTHAVPWVRNYVLRYLKDHLSTIRVPIWVQGKDAAAKSKRAARHLADAERARACSGSGWGGAAESDPFGEVAQSGEPDDRTDRGAAVAALLDDLPERERDVLRRFFGLDGRPPASQQDLGTARGLTRGRINQIYLGGLAMLRARLAERGITSPADL